jgi:hypothetical protein
MVIFLFYIIHIYIILYTLQTNQPLCIIIETSTTSTMPTQHDKKERQAILKALGLKITSISPPVFIKKECAICLKNIHNGEQKTLSCGHVYHGKCLCTWATKDTPDGKMEFRKPIPNRRIHLFKKDQNIFTCPCCRVEYTHDVVTRDIQRVLAKVHMKNKGEDVVHYITDIMETIIFVPFTEFDDDDCVNGKWATILTLLKHAWERGHTDIYALKRLHPNHEFVLTNDHYKLPPLDKTTGLPINMDGNQLLVFREVDADELCELLNNE